MASKCPPLQNDPNFNSGAILDKGNDGKNIGHRFGWLAPLTELEIVSADKFTVFRFGHIFGTLVDCVCVPVLVGVAVVDGKGKVATS